MIVNNIIQFLYLVRLKLLIKILYLFGYIYIISYYIFYNFFFIYICTICVKKIIINFGDLCVGKPTIFQQTSPFECVYADSIENTYFLYYFNNMHFNDLDTYNIGLHFKMTRTTCTYMSIVHIYLVYIIPNWFNKKMLYLRYIFLDLQKYYRLIQLEYRITTHEKTRLRKINDTIFYI